jgi:hypothetical protein
MFQQGLSITRRFVQCAFFMVLYLIGACDHEQTFEHGGKRLAPLESSLDGIAAEVQEFALSRIIDDKISWESSSNEIRETIQMIKGAPQTLSLQQIDRASHSQDLIQGGAGQVIEQTFSLSEAGYLDLLLVIDNSDSMTDYREQVGANLTPMLSSISNTNWRVAIINTDHKCVRNVFTRDDFVGAEQTESQRFYTAVTTGDQLSPVERGIEMAVRGFSSQAECGDADGFAQNNWFRPDSNKVVMIVSDEDNCGSSPEDKAMCGDVAEPGVIYPHFETSDFVAALPEAKVYGILHDPDQCFNGYEGGADEYVDLIDATGGQWRPFCAPDLGMTYEVVLEALSVDIGQIVHRRFDLTAVPDSGTLIFVVDGINSEIPYVLNDQQIEIEGTNIAAEAQKIVMTYVAGTASRFEFVALDAMPDLTTLEVRVDGVEMVGSGYQIDLENLRLTFDQPLADFSEVNLSYRSGGALPFEFSLPEIAYGGAIQVKINQQTIDGSQYEVNSQTLRLAAPPPDAASLEVLYYDEQQIQTNYPSTMGLALVERKILIEDPITGDIIIPQIIDGEIILDKQLVAQRDSLELVHRIYDLNAQLKFPGTPLDIRWVYGEVLERDLVCEEPQQEENGAFEAGCLLQKYRSFEAHYNLVVERFESFEIAFDSAVSSTVVVMVDGQAYDDYVFENNVVTLLNRSALADDSYLQVMAK